MDVIKIAVICIIIGVLIIGKAVYDRNFRNFAPDPKKWGRVRATGTDRHYYREKRINKYGSGFKEGYERVVSYTVDGKTYKVYIEDIGGPVHIYYNRKNPAYFKTMHQIKRAKWEYKSNTYLGIMCFIGGIPLIVGVSILLTIFLEG